MIDVFIEDETRACPDGVKKLITDTVREAAAQEGFHKHSEVDILLVDNEAIREINLEHRKIDRPTDVLSFPMEDFEEDGILGDIVISLERAKEQSEAYGHSFAREVGFLTAHGMLHLFGYDHEAGEEERVMLDKQERILLQLGLTRDLDRDAQDGKSVAERFLVPPHEASFDRSIPTLKTGYGINGGQKGIQPSGQDCDGEE